MCGTFKSDCSSNLEDVTFETQTLVNQCNVFTVMSWPRPLSPHTHLIAVNQKQGSHAKTCLTSPWDFACTRMVDVVTSTQHQPCVVLVSPHPIRRIEERRTEGDPVGNSYPFQTKIYHSGFHNSILLRMLHNTIDEHFIFCFND